MTHVPPRLDHAHLSHSPPGSPEADDPRAGPLQWDEMYAGKPAWDTGRPQPVFQVLADTEALGGRVLDVGCGTGEHVLMCARVGLDATGVDISSAAIRLAELKAHDRGLTARFLLQDGRRLADLGESFDTVLDCGLFVHVVADSGDRTAYLDGPRPVVSPGGRHFRVCFRGQQGHHRDLTHEEIGAAFADGWRVDPNEPATLDGAVNPGDIPAWLAALTRI